MNKKTVLTVVMALLFVWQSPAPAGEVDILVKKLVEKGVLNQQDADVILQETKAEAAKERTETIAATKEALMTGKDAPFVLAEAIPAWIRNTTIKGDFRLRYQYTDRDSTSERNRGRYRLRIAAITKVNEKVDVGFGFATGGSNPRSAVQDMNNSFDKPEIRLDLAYATYKAFKWLTLTGGKFQNPLWLPGDSYLWDSDIRPEGVSAVMNHKAGEVELFMNSGFWILDENNNQDTKDPKAGNKSDPLMWVVQPGYKVNLGKRAYFKNALTLYEFINVEGAVLDYTSKSNTLGTDKTLKYDYDAAVLSGELGYRTGFLLMPFAAVYGEYINNRRVSSGDSGHAFGLKFGHEKVVKRHQWQAGLHYNRLERDAWLDIFPDADTYGGQTNVEAYILRLTYGLMDNVDFTTNFYHSSPLSGPDDEEENLHVELNFKF